jgi:hypothetical protein
MLEVLEGRVVLNAATDVAVLSATTADSRSVLVSYEVRGDAALAQPLPISVVRSADAVFDAGDAVLTVQSVSGADTAVGTHTVTIGVSGGLPIDPARPFVLAVADAPGGVAEADEANNVASFRKYVIGGVTHGLVTGGLPPWVTRTAVALRADGYDRTVAFDWSSASALPLPGQAAAAGRRMAAEVVAAARSLPADAIIDLHLIGHSRGAVVISQAALALEAMVPPATGTGTAPRGLAAGFTKLTFLDPHPAHNVHTVGEANAPFFSASVGPLGRLATLVYRRFQDALQDPDVVVPGTAEAAEVYFQRADHTRAPDVAQKVLNLWGEAPIAGATQACDLTGTVTGHTTMPDWYLQNVVPTLRTASAFVCPPPVDVGPTPPMSRAAGARYEAGLLRPYVRRPAVATALIQRLAPAASALERGNTAQGTRQLASFVQFVRAQRGRGLTPEGADLFSSAFGLIFTASR